MSIYQWLCLFGVPALISGLFGWLFARIRGTAQETQALKLGVQALLRDRLVQSYAWHAEKGYADIDDRANFDNMYKQYHSLGENGVMDNVYKKFFELPISPLNHEDNAE